MRIKPEYSIGPAVIAEPAAAIRHLRANLEEHGIRRFDQDEEFALGFYVPIQGHHLNVSIGVELEEGKDRLVCQSVLLRKLTEDQADLLALVIALNNRLAFVTANLLEGDARRLSFESMLFLANGACLAGQLDHLVGSHIGTLEVYMPILERYFEAGADHEKILTELRK